MQLALGPHRYDVTHQALVVGILNRTPDSFFDHGRYFALDDFLRQADQLVADGADALDVGGVKAGPGTEVTEAEELDRVVPAIAALRRRLDVPVCIDTWRASGLAPPPPPAGAPWMPPCAPPPGGRRCSMPPARRVPSSATTSRALPPPSTWASSPATTPRWSRPTSGWRRASPIPIRSIQTAS